MRQVLLIFRKDVRHLWPQVVILWAMLAGYASLSAAVPAHATLVYVISAPAVVLLGTFAFLVGVLTHADSTMGDRQFWVTRPIYWHELLIAKALFVLVFIALPVLVSHVVTLAAIGMPLLSSILAVLSELGGLAALLAAVFVLAAFTQSLSQLFLLALGGSIVGVISMWTIAGTSYESMSWGGLEWVRGSATNVLVLSGATVLLVLVYRRRSLWMCRALFAGVFLLMPASLCPNWWHAAWNVQAWAYGGRSAPPVSIVFDENAELPANSGWYCYSRDRVVGVKIPVKVRGIPDGMQLIGERLRTKIDAPGGQVWDSGWRAIGGIGATDGRPHLLRHNGPNFLAANVDMPFFDQVKNSPAHVHVTMTFAVLSAPEAVHVPVGGPPRLITPGTVCSLPTKNDPTVWCFSTEGGRAWREVYWEPWKTPQDNGVGLIPRSAFQAFGSFQHRRESVAPFTPFTGSFATVLSRRVESFFETDLDIPHIVLQPREVGRSRGPSQFMETLRINP